MEAKGLSYWWANSAKNPKRNLLILSYGAVMVQTYFGEAQSIFIYLFLLLLEFVVLVLFYVIYDGFTNSESGAHGSMVFAGAIPLVVFNMFILSFATDQLEELEGLDLGSDLGMWSPLLVYRKQIILIGLGVLLGHLIDFWNLHKSNSKMRAIQSRVIFQALKIWALGNFTLLILMIIPSKYYGTGILLLPLARILLEFSVKNNGLRDDPKKAALNE